MSLLLAFQLFGNLDADSALRLHLAAALATLAAASLVLGRLVLRVPREGPRLVSGREWLRGALPMWISGTLRAVDAHFAVLILATMVAVADVGLFRVALSCAVFVSLPYSVFGMFSLPVAARLAAEKNQRGLQMFASAVSVVSSGSIAFILLVLWFFGEDLIGIVFGSAYTGSWSILMVLGLANLLAASTGVSTGVLTATGNERAVTMAFALSVLVGLVSTVVFVTFFGLKGAAWAIVISTALRSTLLYRSTVARTGIDPSILSVSAFLNRQAVSV
jgi:O-antigen/teichoic acid export membrane protein